MDNGALDETLVGALDGALDDALESAKGCAAACSESTEKLSSLTCDCDIAAETILERTPDLKELHELSGFGSRYTRDRPESSPDSKRWPVLCVDALLAVRAKTLSRGSRRVMQV